MNALRPLAAVLLAFVLVFAGCGGGAPKPARREVILSSEAVDERVGQEAAADVTAGLGIVDDPELTKYVNQVGQRLARNAPRGGFQYHFAIVDQDAPNAFALPGGYIYVSRGLLTLANSEDELANVLGHEIVHVSARHAAARQAVIRGLPGPIKLFAQGHIAGYSRDQEREADRIGQGLAGVSGYDPESMATFLRQLEFTERLRLGTSRLPRFFDTHPATTERVSAAGARARMVAWQRPAGGAPDRADYLHRIEGLVVGTSAAEGVFQGERFIHPDLDFGVRFPDGWTTLNTHVAVAGVDPLHDAQIILEGQEKAPSPEAAAARYLAQPENQGVQISWAAPLLIGEYNAYRIDGQAATPYGWLPIAITWIARPDLVFRFTLVTKPGSFRRYESAYGALVRSFRPLAPQVRNSVYEDRVHIATAVAGETLASLSKRTNNQWDIQTTAVYNQMFSTTALAPGQLVKVAVAHLHAPDRPAN
jgi:predicted Zn-dependent protease